MKIYYIANARMPTEKAHGIQLAKMCEAFVAAGADLELVLPNRKNTEKSIEGFYGLKQKIPIKKLPVLDVYKMGRFGFIAGTISFIFTAFLYLSKKRIGGEKMALYTVDMDNFSYLWLPFLFTPFFVELHNVKTRNFRNNFCLKRAKGIIAINNIIREKLIKYFGFAPGKVIVHPNGIDLERYVSLPSRDEARKILNLPIGQKIALYAGRIYDWKGLGILSALALKKSIMFYVVGGTRDNLESVTGEKMSHSVICAGPCDFQSIPTWLAAADILVAIGTKNNPYSYYHTSPMKIFEYMASRRPILAARTPAIEQIMTDEETAFYTPDDAGDLSSMIETVVADPDTAAAKPENAYEKLKKFSWDNRARDIMSFIGC
ncbi:MAG: glycosyltransferase family 4 protein [Patescibacteria group bacterium]